MLLHELRPEQGQLREMRMEEKPLPDPPDAYAYRGCWTLELDMLHPLKRMRRPISFALKSKLTLHAPLEGMELVTHMQLAPITPHNFGPVPWSCAAQLKGTCGVVLLAPTLLTLVPYQCLPLLG